MEDLQASLQCLAVCVRIAVPNRAPLLLADHDADILITVTDETLAEIRTGFDLTGRYRARTGVAASDVKTSTNQSVDNVDIQGVSADEQELIPGITVADMEAGLLDHAQATMFYLRWDAPDRWQNILRYGNLGEFRRDSSGQFSTEIRGLAQALQQNVGDQYSDRCVVKRFGDSRCKFNVASVTRTGVIASVTNRKAFTVTLTPGTDPPWPDFFNGGALVFTSGANDGYEREALAGPVSGGTATVILWDELPADAQIGDTLTFRPDCSRLPARCKDYENFVNFQGYGLFMAGPKALMRGPQGAQSSAGTGNPDPPTFTPS